MNDICLPTLLRSRGLRLIDVAKAMGVDKATVTRWAQKQVPSDRVAEVSHFTGIPPEELRPDLAALFAPTHPKEREGA